MHHLLELMDLDWLPSGLRGTLREILESGNNLPFRPYYRWVADEVLRVANAGGFTTLVELGAGPGPITRLLAKDPRSAGLRLIPCDRNPDRLAYESLAREYPGKVVPRFDPVDFSQPQQWPPNTLLCLSGTFHHIEPAARDAVFLSLTHSAAAVMVFEPLRKTVASMFFVLLSSLPAVLLPVQLISRPGWLRRLFWCWLFPVAPLMFLWDGWVSALRMWTDEEWRGAARRVLDSEQRVTVVSTLFCQAVASLSRPMEPSRRPADPASVLSQ